MRHRECNDTSIVLIQDGGRRMSIASNPRIYVMRTLGGAEKIRGVLGTKAPSAIQQKGGEFPD